MNTMAESHGVSWRRRAFGTLLVAALAFSMPMRAEGTTTLTATIRVQPGTDVAALIAGYGGTVVETHADMDAASIRLPSSSLGALRDNAAVVEVTLDTAPNENPQSEAVADERRGRPIGFVEADHGHDEGGSSFPRVDLNALAEIVDARQAWRVSRGAGVDIALIDTGVAPVAGAGPTINGPDLSFDAPNPAYLHHDGYGHGTHLAGIINGTTTNGTGLAPYSRVVDVRVGASNGAVDVSQVIAAIDWVVQHRSANGMNIRVLVLAYGTDGMQSHQVDPLAAAVENAWRNGIVVVVAAGNRGDAAASLDNPALDPWVIAVGASEPNGTYTTADDTVAPFTNQGSASRGVDLVAPGRSIVSLRVPNSYVDLAHPEGRVGDTMFRGSGTSQAAAVVGAAAALLVSNRPGLTPDQVKHLLLSTARPLPQEDDAREGAGVVDFDRAVRARTPSTATQPWAWGDGTGSLELARGTSHVVMPDGQVLEGELTVWGQPWNGTSWSGQSWSGTSWSGTSWSGTSWSGGSWLGTSWSGTSWSGTSWSGTSWSGQSWSGQSWSGTSWSGTSWSGTSWSGTSWSGQSWSGTSWSGTSWSSADTSDPVMTTA